MHSDSPDPRPDTALLQQIFGLPALRPHQRQSLNALRAGRDVLVVLSTGGGKSLCYQFPAVAGLAPALVVSPLIALMKDQVDALRRRGISAAQLSANSPPAEREHVWREYEAHTLKLLYLSPEALESPTTIERVARAAPRLLAIDEAHCISEWGESFRPSYRAIGRVRRAIGSPPTIALTATATARTQRDIIELLELKSPECIVSGFDRPNLQFEVERVANDAARWQRLTTLARERAGCTVFYATTRRRTEALAAHLHRTGIPARAYHAGLPSHERAEVQDDFLTSKVPVIVATCAFGMGVDKPDVRLVVHAGPPPTLESYYQEAGRAGRDGAPGRCVALLSPNDIVAARERLAAEPPSLELLHRFYSLARDCQRRRDVLSDDVAPIAAALNTTPRTAAHALTLLVQANMLERVHEPSAPLRILATPERLAANPSLNTADVAFLERVLARQRERTANALFTRAELSALETELSLDARLARMEANQLLLWRAPHAHLRCADAWDESLIRQLQDQDRRRTRRDLWRFEGVARFLTTTRCRRLLLLRYFGEELPHPWCGQCDSCFARAVTKGTPTPGD